VIVQLFIYLDELDESLLKKYIAMIRQRLESAEEQGEIEVKLMEVQQQRQEVNLDSSTTAVSDVVASPVEASTEPTESQRATETTIETATETIPLPLRIQGRHTVQQNQIIPLDKTCFGITKRLERRSFIAAKTARTRAVKEIVTAVLNKSLTGPQQVHALRLAVKHKLLKIHSTSADLLPDSPNNVDHHIVSNIQDTLQLARKTDHTNGRVNNDRRSLVNSIVLSCLSSARQERKIGLRSWKMHWGYQRVHFTG